jgi:hypothetical protein
MTPRDWVIVPEFRSVPLQGALPFLGDASRRGYPTQEAAERRREIVLIDYQKRKGFNPKLKVVPRF